MEPKSKRRRTWGVTMLVVTLGAILLAVLILSRSTPPDNASNITLPTTQRDVATNLRQLPPAQPGPSLPAAPAAPSTHEALDAANTPRLMMYNCGNVTISTRTVSGEAMLFAPELIGNESLTLKQTEAESGERYAAGDAVFWNKGNVATFELRGQVFADCTPNSSKALQAQAQARGVIVWAKGSQPSWILEITPQQLSVTMEPGARRNEFPYRVPTAPGAGSKYPTIVGTYRSLAGTQEIIVVVDQNACNDSQSGEAFPVTVAVTFEQRTLYGCGQIFPLNVPRSQ